MEVRCVFLLVTAFAAAQEEMLQNRDFEDPLSNQNWKCLGGCTVTRNSTDPYNQSYSGLVTSRTKDSSTVSQRVTLEKNTTYAFSCYIKLEEQAASALFHIAKAQVTYFKNNKKQKVVFGRLPHLKKTQGWQKISGDFYMDDNNVTKERVAVHIGDDVVDFRVDSCSLVKLPDNPNWKSEATARIDQIRKNNITINLSLNEAVNASSIQIDIKLVSRAFPLGAAVKGFMITGTNNDSLKYQKTFYDNFQGWSVLANDLKWKAMERRRDEIDYPDPEVEILRNKGYKLRAHTVFWNKKDAHPTWVWNLNASELETEMDERIAYLFPHYNGKFEHWDIINEQLHDSYYEDFFQKADVTVDIFNKIKASEPNATLFLNDYGIVKHGLDTQAYANCVDEYGTIGGAPIEAMGIQSHLFGFVGKKEITAMAYRLKTLASAGIPMWITELDISEVSDATDLANSYDDVLTLYFSNPNIHGIMLWGFSDRVHSKPDAALFEGPEYIANESGLRYQGIVRERWNTTATFNPSSNEQTFNLRGFQGNYTLTVKDTSNNTVLSTTDVILNPGSDVTVAIAVSKCKTVSFN